MQSLAALAKRMPIAAQLYRYSQSFYQKLDQVHQVLDDLYQVEAQQYVDRLMASREYGEQRKLNRWERKVFSQSGEDGIIAEIFRRIGSTHRTFVEFAAGDGIENNTAYLLHSGWTGFWIEAHDAYVNEILSNHSRKIEEGALRFRRAFVTAENIESLLEGADVPEEIDLLSIDIDRNDYWVWSKIARCRPRVVVIEYNAVLPPGFEWVVDYAPNATWDGTSNFGASLTALELLGVRKGYRLVGCDLTGVNAFFVRDDLVGELFCGPFTAENHYEPPRYYLTRRLVGHPRTVAQIWRKPFIIDRQGRAIRVSSEEPAGPGVTSNP